MSLRWFPAHVGRLGLRTGLDNRNEEADSAARNLTCRATPTSQASPPASPTPEEPTPLTTYGDILEWYRLTRRLYPPPHPQLSREESVLYRQLQTNSLLTPVLARHICPQVYETDMCRLCSSARATTAHLLWDCQSHPIEALQEELPPNITIAMNSYDHTTQLQAVQQVAAALARQRPASATSPGEARVGHGTR